MFATGNFPCERWNFDLGLVVPTVPTLAFPQPETATFTRNGAATALFHSQKWFSLTRSAYCASLLSSPPIFLGTRIERPPWRWVGRQKGSHGTRKLFNAVSEIRMIMPISYFKIAHQTNRCNVYASRSFQSSWCSPLMSRELRTGLCHESTVYPKRSMLAVLETTTIPYVFHIWRLTIWCGTGFGISLEPQLTYRFGHQFNMDAKPEAVPDSTSHRWSSLASFRGISCGERLLY